MQGKVQYWTEVTDVDLSKIYQIVVSAFFQYGQQTGQIFQNGNRLEKIVLNENLFHLKVEYGGHDVELI